MGLAQFGALILRRRRELKLTQEQLAGQVGVHPNYIGCIERGLRRPRDRTLVSLCRVLQLDKACVFATLNPLFRDVLRGEVPLETDGLPPALRELLADAALVRSLGATPEELAKLQLLEVFGTIATKEDYARLWSLIREETD
jgi:transcriptional regulator with XRE-family HTH domain